MITEYDRSFNGVDFMKMLQIKASLIEAAINYINLKPHEILEHFLYDW